MMKKILFLFGLLVCLAGMPLTAFADNKTAKQEEDQESMDPYTKAKKSCDAKLNADGANAALENIIRIQKDRLSDQKELQALWAKVDKLLK